MREPGPMVIVSSKGTQISWQAACDKDRKRILLVEDDPAVRRSLQLLLFSQGYDVRAYSSGEGLAQDPEAMRADCLVADLMIGDGDAVSLLCALRGAGWNGPAVLISGHLTKEWILKALASGYAAAFPKPMGASVLVNCLKELMTSRFGAPHASQ